ncbi:hypothetical protein Hdeb2414_s1063g00977381 [Helianthus debilis subsp. tardiflorus]
MYGDYLYSNFGRFFIYLFFKIFIIIIVWVPGKWVCGGANGIEAESKKEVWIWKFWVWEKGIQGCGQIVWLSNWLLVFSFLLIKQIIVLVKWPNFFNGKVGSLTNYWSYHRATSRTTRSYLSLQGIMLIHQYRRKPNNYGKNLSCGNRTNLLVSKPYPTIKMSLDYKAMNS